MGRSRARRSARRNTASDLGARVWVAIPAAAYAIFIVWRGDWIFALGVLLLGFVCLHELFRMYDHVRPVRLAGFLGVIGLDRRGALRRRAPGAAGHRRLHPGRLPAGARAARAQRPAAHRRHGHHDARHLLDRARPSPTPCCCASSRTATASSSPCSSARSSATRRPTSAAATSACASSRRGSRPTRRSRGWSSACSARRWRCGAPACTRTGSAAGLARCSALVVGVAGADRRPLRVEGQARCGDQGRGDVVRCARRRAGPAGRRAVHARRRGTTLMWLVSHVRADERRRSASATAR